MHLLHNVSFVKLLTSFVMNSKIYHVLAVDIKDATVGGVGGIPAPQYQGTPENFYASPKY